MSESVLLIEKKDGIATATLNRPAKMNALSSELRGALRRAFMDFADDPEVEVIILTGAGKAFCGGLDLKELSSKGISDEGSSDSSALGSGSSGESFFINADRFDKPIIGAINGAAVTGGFELALVCDILIASTQAVFADTHARVGFMPGAGLSQKLSRLIGINRAKELSLTGNFLQAKQAEAWGLVNRVVEPDELLAVCRALATDIISSPSDAVRTYKRLINDGFGMSYSDAIKLEGKVFLEQAMKMSADIVETRRKAIMDRGREQKNPSDK